ncbi:MAG: oxidoreductase [Gammaproteobacteria bacterium]|nr:oxidoreductase [Gammaproteobacteria bacterium]MCG3144027.1 putative acrylyl-CoA reductase AcuI [Gammaproteobacteria bacterium]
MRETFRVLRAVQADGRTTAVVEQATLDDLSPGEVVIRACYSDVNYKDALAATGRNGIIREFPRVPGIDVAGVVESSTDPRFCGGDPVLVTGHEFGTGHDGGFAEYVRAPAEWVVRLPDGLRLYEAMALGTAGFTVALCVKRLEENGQRPEQGPIAVTGATGGVGSIAIDVLSRLGYSVTAITGKSADGDYLRMLGAAEVLNRHSIAYGTQPLDRPIWAGAIDNVGGELLAWLTRTVKPWGNVCAVGLAGGTGLNATVLPFILRGIALLGVTASNCVPEWREGLWRRLAADLKPRHLAAMIKREVTLDELPAVFDAMLAGTLTGRTVVRIAEP